MTGTEPSYHGGEYPGERVEYRPPFEAVDFVPDADLADEIPPEFGDATAARVRFPLVAFGDLTISTASSYLVKGLIPREGLTVVWGPPKCGKSFWVFDLTMQVALGWEYRGRRVHQGSVIYCAMEGAAGFKARAEAFRRRSLDGSEGEVPFYLMPSPMALVKDHVGLIAAIRVKLDDLAPVVVVLDTLNRSLTGSESSDEDMSAYVHAADAIRAAFACAVIIVHHCGTDDTRPRGHTSLTGAADAQLATRRDDDKNIVITVEYMKDGAEGDVITSRLDVVDLGVDDDGDAITSCVVLPAGAQLFRKVAPGKPPTGRRALLLDAIREAISVLPGQPPTSNYIPPNVLATTRKNVAEFARRKGFATGGTDAAFRAQLSNVLGGLAGDHLIGMWKDSDDDSGTEWLWLAS